MRLCRIGSLAAAWLLLATLAHAAGAPSSPRAHRTAAATPQQPVLEALASWNAGSPVLAPQVALRVNGMPSTFGADIGSPQPASWIGRDNIVWGNVVGGTGPYTFNFHFDEGGADITGAVTDPRYIRTHRTYSTLGPKFVTLTVTDDVGATNSETIRIDVGPFGIASRVPAAIEDGLRFLYLTQQSSGTWSTGNQEAEGLHALAFQLRGHDKNNNPDTDIYAETLQAYWNYIFAGTSQYPIGPQPAGNPDTNGNGYAIYCRNYTEGYNHGLLTMAMAGIDNLDEVLTVGSEVGRTIRDVLQDMIDLSAYSQTEGGSERGGWRYSVLTSSYGSDNSAVQWIVLGMIAAERRGLVIPAFVKSELELWTVYSQGADGGFGYTGVDYWQNIAKTGAGLVQLGWLGYPLASPQVQAGIGFLDTHWTAVTDGFGTTEHFGDGGYYSNSYSAYAVKKGLEEFKPGGNLVGVHDWQDEYNKNLVADPSNGYDGVGGVAFSTDNLEQQFGVDDMTDGSWTDNILRYDYWLYSYDRSLPTAIDVLILTEGVISLVPVANCTINPPQTAPGANVNLSAAGSFHQDPNRQIVAYLWDFDDSDGVNFVTPDASGISVNTSYTLGPGVLSRTFNITLRVRDDAVPPVERDARCTVIISRENNPPVAVPGGPYSACVGNEICVDGSGSYDPDAGDFVAAYHWDLDGDGLFDDFDGPATCVTFAGLYDGFIGLQVVDSFGVPSANAGAVVRIFTALGDLTTSDADLVVTSDAGCVQGGETCVAGTYRVLSDDPTYVVQAARVDFYVDDPSDPLKRIATYTDNNLTNGMLITHTACFNRPDNLPHAVFMVLDPQQTLNECVETDNVAVHRFACGGCTPEAVNLVLVDYETVNWDPITLIWDVRVRVRNAGPGTAYGVTSTLMEEIDWVTPVDGTSSYGDIGPGEAKFGDTFTLDLTGRPGPGGFNVFFNVAYTNNCQEPGTVRLDPEAVIAGEGGRSSVRKYSLSQNSPNPFNPRTTISFTLERPGHARLEVFDARGRLVKTLVDGQLAATQHQVDWDGTDLTGQPVSSGLYYYRVSTDEFTQTRKMTLVK